MNDQLQMMNQQPAPLPMKSQPPPQPPILTPSQVLNPILNPVQPVMVQSKPMNPAQSQILSHSQQPPPPMMLLNQRSYSKKPKWNLQQQPQQQQQQQQDFSLMDPNKILFQNQQQQQQNPSLKFNINTIKPRNKNWKGKNVNLPNKPPMTNITPNNSGIVLGGSGGYKPPSLNELQTQNRMKARKFYHPKKKFNNNNNNNNNNRFKPYAPRNTTSFIIRAKKAGGIASLVSPCPVTPAVLPTPIFSPSREVLGDMAKEEWGVDGYGSMKGLIRLRNEVGAGGLGTGEVGVGHDEEEEEEGNGSSESDVEEHVEVERRLDHDLSRFEMIYPSYGGGEYGGVGVGSGGYSNVLENRVDDQDTHIAQLEEENLTLKERLFLMERELGDLRRRLQYLERQQHIGDGCGAVGIGGQGSSVAVMADDVNEEVVENVSENDENESDGGSDVGGGIGGATGVSQNNEEVVMECTGGSGETRNVGNEVKEERNDVCMEEFVPCDKVVMKDSKVKHENAARSFVVNDKVIVKEDEVRDQEMRDGFVATDTVMVKENAAKGEEEKVVAKEEEEMSEGDDAMNKIVQDKVIAEKDESKNDEVCLEKSIGSGD